ncbi:MAG: YtxH domain-containing protein [Bacteroidetes bacterium]|nr:YtxH domain-containing protein [Bacteroidota bacterium]
MTKKTMIIGFVAIGAIAAATLLLSTEKGANLRKQLKKKGMDMADLLKNKMNKYTEAKV